jgi:hypothetical protein
MRSAAFLEAERARRANRLPSDRQRRTLALLSRRAGIEMPEVRWRSEASDAITRLERLLRQPILDGFKEAIA